MPTYAYRCDACGTAADEWLKMSEAHAERVCPSCGQATYRKQLTAPAFQLKGGGWYVTDFRNGQAGAPNAKKDDAAAESKSDDAKPNESKADDAKATNTKTTSASNDAKNASGNDASSAGNAASGGTRTSTPGSAV